MRLVWDESKRLANLEKHGIDLTDNDRFDSPGARVVPARGRRKKAIGQLDDDLFAVIFAPLGTEAISVISMRRASRTERRLHDDR